MINLKKLDELNLIEQLNTVIDMSLELKELKAPDFILNGVDELLVKVVFILNDNDASDGLIEQWVNKCLWQVQGCYFAYKERQMSSSVVAKLKETIEEIYSRKEEINKMAARY